MLRMVQSVRSMIILFFQLCEEKDVYLQCLLGSDKEKINIVYALIHNPIYRQLLFIIFEHELHESNELIC